MTKPVYTHGTFCWNELGTTDTAEARDFYTSLLGWTSVDTPMPQDMGTYTLLNLRDQNVAGMYKLQGPQFEGVPSHWLSYVWVDAVDASAEKIARLGGKLVAPPMDIEGVGRMAIAADPTGAQFAVYRGREHPGAAQFDDSPEGSFCWNECISSDVAKAAEFYCALFGWTANQHNPDYTMLMSGDRMAGGLMALKPEMGPVSNWMAYISVDNCDASAAETAKLGGRVLAGPMEIPTAGRFAVLQDPTGAVVSIIALAQRTS